MMMDGNSADITQWICILRLDNVAIILSSWTWLVVGSRENSLLAIPKSCQVAGTSYFLWSFHFVEFDLGFLILSFQIFRLEMKFIPIKIFSLIELSCLQQSQYQ